MSDSSPPREPVLLHNLGVIFFNWLPALGCLAIGVCGLIVGSGSASYSDRVGGGLYLLAGAVGFAAFGWIWRRD